MYDCFSGLNAWWTSFLVKTPDAAAQGGYVYHDTSATDPDEEHEGQKAPRTTLGPLRHLPILSYTFLFYEVVLSRKTLRMLFKLTCAA